MPGWYQLVHMSGQKDTTIHNFTQVYIRVNLTKTKQIIYITMSYALLR